MMKQVTRFFLFFSFSFWSESKLHVKTFNLSSSFDLCRYIRAGLYVFFWFHHSVYAQYQPSLVTHIIQPNYFYFYFVANYYYKQITIQKPYLQSAFVPWISWESSESWKVSFGDEYKMYQGLLWVDKRRLNTNVPLRELGGNPKVKYSSIH